MSAISLKILGCGASSAVPTLTGWGNCDPQEPRNRRTRSSALFEVNQRRFLIDASPDVYTQFRREDLQSIDAIFLSHFHGDHTAGLVDLFFLSRLIQRRIPLFSNTKTITHLKKSFPFMFEGLTQGFAPHIMAYGGQEILGIEWHFFPMEHGKVQSIGVRLGNVAYVIDANDMTERAQKVLEGVQQLVMPARSFAGSAAHMSLDDALRWCDHLQVEEGYLTNLGADLDYAEVSKMLPDHRALCFDGFIIHGRF